MQASDLQSRERIATERLRFRWNSLKLHPCSLADVAELADALDSKSSDRKIVWVRSPPSARPHSRLRLERNSK
jgi:hypothetical protein